MDSNSMNVFKGPGSLAQYLDPDQNPMLPLVEIPDSLNPLRGDGVRIFAKMLTALPAHNVKSLPGMQSSYPVLVSPFFPLAGDV